MHVLDVMFSHPIGRQVCNTRDTFRDNEFCNTVGIFTGCQRDIESLDRELLCCRYRNKATHAMYRLDKHTRVSPPVLFSRLCSTAKHCATAICRRSSTRLSAHVRVSFMARRSQRLFA